MNARVRLSSRRGRTAGATMVEVLFSIVLLGVLTIAGLAYLYHSKADILHARNRRAATEAATGRLEALRMSIYRDIAPAGEGYAAVYLSRSNQVWIRSASDPGETVDINGRELPIATTVQFADIEPGESDSYDYLVARVQVGYRPGSPDRVTIETRIAP